MVKLRSEKAFDYAIAGAEALSLLQWTWLPHSYAIPVVKVERSAFPVSRNAINMLAVTFGE